MLAAGVFPSSISRFGGMQRKISCVIMCLPELLEHKRTVNRQINEGVNE